MSKNFAAKIEKNSVLASKQTPELHGCQFPQMCLFHCNECIIIYLQSNHKYKKLSNHQDPEKTPLSGKLNCELESDHIYK